MPIIASRQSSWPGPKRSSRAMSSAASRVASASCARDSAATGRCTTGIRRSRDPERGNPHQLAAVLNPQGVVCRGGPRGAGRRCGHGSHERGAQFVGCGLGRIGSGNPVFGVRDEVVNEGPRPSKRGQDPISAIGGGPQDRREVSGRHTPRFEGFKEADDPQCREIGVGDLGHGVGEVEPPVGISPEGRDQQGVGEQPGGAARLGETQPSKQRSRTGGAVHSRSLLQLGEVAVELELGDLLPVFAPLRPLVAQEEVEDVLSEGFGDQLAALHDLQRAAQR
jgi:hypothetical protein